MKKWVTPKKIDSFEDMLSFVRYICRTRDDDVTESANYPNVFIRGRLVGKIPTGSADVDSTDKIGDINFTDDYMYVLVDNSGTAEWRRVALGTW